MNGRNKGFHVIKSVDEVGVCEYCGAIDKVLIDPDNRFACIECLNIMYRR